MQVKFLTLIQKSNLTGVLTGWSASRFKKTMIAPHIPASALGFGVSVSYKFSMNRRTFLGTLTATAAGSATFNHSAESPGAVPAQSPSALTKTPLVLMAPRADGCEAIWAVNQLSRGHIEWESMSGGGGTISSDRFGFVPQSREVIRIRLEGLTPGAEYRVRSVTISAADGLQETSPWKSFRTLHPSAGTTQFVVWNDTHIHNATIQRLHEVTPSADFLFWNGDTCNDWKTDDILIPTLLNPGERDITNGRPLFIAWGNHDSRGPHAFEMPNTVATPNNRPFYAFRSGPVPAICLHTGEDKPDDHPSFGGRVAFDALRREQAAWLAETIRLPEFRDAPYRILFCHIPLRWLKEESPDYTKGGYDHFSLRSRAAWHQSLVEWKTQLVISGHTHRDAFLPATEAFPYAQITGGGPQAERATWMQAKADENEFNLKVAGLDGATRHEVKLRPLA